MKRNKELNIIGLIMLVIFCAGVFLFVSHDVKEAEKRHQAFLKNYPLISYKDSVYDTVVYIKVLEKSIIRSNPDVVHIELSQKGKLTIVGNCLTVDSLNLYEVIKPGIVLKKETNSDKLWIYEMRKSDTLKILFQLLDYKYRPLTK